MTILLYVFAFALFVGAVLFVAFVLIKAEK